MHTAEVSNNHKFEPDSVTMMNQSVVQKFIDPDRMMSNFKVE